MESRLRNSPTHIFECWCEVVAPQGSNHPPWIIQKFPRSYEDSALKNVPQFTFPCTFTKKSVEHFSFVLTDLESKFLYGFCRHAPDSESAFVILSRLPWDKLFYKVLNYCSGISSSSTGDLWTYLKSLYQVSVPAPGEQLKVCYSNDKYFTEDCPNHLALPSIPENRNLNEYFNAVDVDNMIIIFASMLNERRIIVISDRVSRLSSCVQAANYLIYPMTWQHIFIPVLPEDLLDYLHAPMPFLIGVSSPLMKKVKKHELGEVVILDADNNKIETPFSDIDEIPEEVVSFLHKNLKPTNSLLGDNVAKAFLKAIVQLIGNYREALTFRDKDKCINFDEEKFMSIRPHHFRPFVQKMLQLQLFKQFIEERLQLLNAGLHTSDVFELEASIFEEKSVSKVKLMYSNVKKESGAMMMDIKKKVKKHSKSVEKKSKNAYKDIKGKFKDLQQPPIFPDKYSYGSSRPKSAPSSPHFGSHFADSGYFKGHTSKVSYVKPTKDPEKETLKSASMTSSESEKTPSPQSMDLIGELEIALNTQFHCEKNVYFNERLSNSSNLDRNSDSTTKASLDTSSTNRSSAYSTDHSQASSYPDSKSDLSESSMSKSLMEQDLMLFDSPQEDTISFMSNKDLIPSTNYENFNRKAKITSAYSVQPNTVGIFAIPKKSCGQAAKSSSYNVNNEIYCNHVPLIYTQSQTPQTVTVGRPQTVDVHKILSLPNTFSQPTTIAGSGFSTVNKENDLLGDFSADFANFCINNKSSMS